MRVLIVLLMLAPLGAAAAPNDARTLLVGQWRRPYERASLQFSSDGTCTLAARGEFAKPVAKCTWTLARDRLTLTNTEGTCATQAAERVGHYKITVAKDSLHFQVIGTDSCLRRATIDGNTWVRIDPKRPFDAPIAAMDQLAPFAGDWSCETREKGATAVSKSRAHFAPDWSGAWQTVRDEVLDGGKPVDGSHGSWGYNPRTQTFVRLFTMRAGSWETATSPGFVGDRMVWTGESHGRDVFKFRHTFVRKGDRRFEAVYEVTDGPRWDRGSSFTEVCTRP